MCLHTGNTKEGVDRSVDGMVRWAQEILSQREREIELVKRSRHLETGGKVNDGKGNPAHGWEL